MFVYKVAELQLRTTVRSQRCNVINAQATKCEISKHLWRLFFLLHLLLLSYRSLKIRAFRRSAEVELIRAAAANRRAIEKFSFVLK